MKSQVDPEHYKRKEYDSKERFCSYWHQIQEILNLNPQKTLEIGIGSGFVCEYLRKKGLKIITLDIDKRLNPDMEGSVLKMPFNDASFDVVACYEVLEHMPYEDFNKALSEIFRVSKKYAVLSLPDIQRHYYFHVTIPKFRGIKRLFTLPRREKPIHKFDGEHYWEIGKKRLSIK